MTNKACLHTKGGLIAMQTSLLFYATDDPLTFRHALNHENEQ